MDIPNELFKYRDFGKYTILSLLTEGVWIPKPAQLNDPFDAQLKMSNSDVSLDEFKSACSPIQNWCEDEGVDVISNEVLESLFENNKPNEELRKEIKLFRQFWNIESEKIGILSLSEDPESTTMWSHYAENHTGICIGYDPIKLAPKSPNGVKDWLRKVEYLEEHEIIRNAYLLFAKAGMGEQPKLVTDQLFKMFSTKSVDWSYEKEWRFICPDLGGDVYHLEIDAITSITFGLRTSVETKTAVSHLLKYHQMKVKIFQAIRCEHTIGLDRISMDIKSEYWRRAYE